MVEALSYIRGRSIAHQFMVIDEAQNLTPLEVKTIITRVGQGTKIIFTGDPYQIDNPYVDSTSNGFNYIVSKFRHQIHLRPHRTPERRTLRTGRTGRQFALGAAGSRLVPPLAGRISSPSQARANAAFCPGCSGAV